MTNWAGARSVDIERPGVDVPNGVGTISSVKRHLYNQAWVDLLAERLATSDEFERTTGKPAVKIDERGSLPGG